MDFEVGGDNVRTGGGGNALLGLLAGTALNKDRDDGKTSTMLVVLAVIFFVIVFIIALVFLAMAFKDKGYDKVHNNGNYGELLATMIAAKGMDGNKNYDHDHLEIKDQIAHSEDRREISGVKSELGALGLLLQKTASDNEKDNLKEFGDIKQQLGMLNMGVNTLLTERNNAAIIQGVVNQLMLGKPCLA